jgi:dsRNA-specific ribonuclease
MLQTIISLQLYEEGPPHLKVFVWSCVFNGLDAKGTGRSKKEAKVAAATELKRNLDLDALPPIVEKKKRPNT